MNAAGAGAGSNFTAIGLAMAGLLFGVLLTLLAAGVIGVLWATWQQRKEGIAARTLINQVIARNTSAIALLKTEVAMALNRMDADRIHDAGMAIQAGVKSLHGSVQTLSKLLYATPGAGAGTVDQYGISNSGLTGMAGMVGNNTPMDEEAEQDAAQDEQWSARPRQVQDMYSTKPAWAQGIAAQTENPFEAYRAVQQAKEDAAQGRPSPVPISVLPDVDEGHDLDAQQGSELSYLATSQVPGFTERPE